jgi:hypothetical protein
VRDGRLAARRQATRFGRRRETRLGISCIICYEFYLLLAEPYNSERTGSAVRWLADRRQDICLVSQLDTSLVWCQDTRLARRRDPRHQSSHRYCDGLQDSMCMHDTCRHAKLCTMTSVHASLCTGCSRLMG